MEEIGCLGTRGGAVVSAFQKTEKKKERCFLCMIMCREISPLRFSVIFPFACHITGVISNYTDFEGKGEDFKSETQD